MIFIQAFLLFVFDRIFLSGSVIFENHEILKFSIDENIPQVPAITSDKFLQKLDHFNPTDVRTWKQVYYSDKSNYQKGGPVYLLIGGQEKANPKQLQEGYWRSNGEKNKAMLFLVEHRYYGDSQPQKDLSTDHLSYLTTAHALADLATFIVFMNKEYKFPPETKWIAFGGSYAGNLAAWMRMKYPHLIHGAVASSAPVLAQFNFPEYWDGVGNALASYKKECRRDITTANTKLDKLVRTADGRKQIEKLFKLCTPLSSRWMDKSYLFQNMADYFAITVESDRWGKDIKQTCEKMLESSCCATDPVERYANTLKMLMDKNGESCLPTNSTQFIEYMKKDDLDTSVKSSRAKWYQICTEYGYHRSVRKSNNTFSKRITIGFTSGWCSKIFKSSFNKIFMSQAIDDTNKFFGGLKINIPRILFIHGSIDPWQVLGISNANKTSSLDTILIKGGSHCSDIRVADNNDSKDVKDARTKVSTLLDKWLKEK